MMIYNIFVPIPPDQPFKPMSDGRSPFSRKQWTEAGFVVHAFDEDDSKVVRRLIATTHGDDPVPPAELEQFHALYTLVERPER